MKNNHPIIDTLYECKGMYLEQLKKATDERDRTFIRYKLQELDRAIVGTRQILKEHEALIKKYGITGIAHDIFGDTINVNTISRDLTGAKLKDLYELIKYFSNPVYNGTVKIIDVMQLDFNTVAEFTLSNSRVRTVEYKPKDGEIVLKLMRGATLRLFNIKFDKENYYE